MMYLQYKAETNSTAGRRGELPFLLEAELDASQREKKKNVLQHPQ